MHLLYFSLDYIITERKINTSVVDFVKTLMDLKYFLLLK